MENCLGYLWKKPFRGSQTKKKKSRQTQIAGLAWGGGYSPGKGIPLLGRHHGTLTLTGAKAHPIRPSICVLQPMGGPGPIQQPWARWELHGPVWAPWQWPTKLKNFTLKSTWVRGLGMGRVGLRIQIPHRTHTAVQACYLGRVFGKKPSQIHWPFPCPVPPDYCHIMRCFPISWYTKVFCVHNYERPFLT